MAIEEKDVTSALQEFLANQQIKDRFIQAPIGAQKRMALSFYFSKFCSESTFDRDIYRSLRSFLEKALSVGDLDYLISTEENENAKKHYEDLREQKGQGQEQGQVEKQFGIGATGGSKA